MTNEYVRSEPKGFQYQTTTSVVYGPSEDAYGGSDPLPAFTRLSWTNSIDGFKNPLWRTQVLRSENATTPMTAKEVEIIQKPGYFSIVGNLNSSLPPNRRVKTIVMGSMGFTPSNANIPSHDAIPAGTAPNDAAGEWYNQVRNKMSTFKGSVFTAEAREAKRMMIDRAQKMITKIPAFQDRLRKRWVKSRTKRGKLKTLSNSWLELQFGWLPLASDIEDLYKVLHNPRSEFAFVKAYGVDGTQGSKSFSAGGVGNVQYFAESWESTWYQVKYFGKIRARNSPVGSRLLDFGLGVREFLPTLWEVIPWSFAIDYFTNVSEIVNAVSYRNVKVEWVNCTHTRNRTYNRTSHGVQVGTLFQPVIYGNIPSITRIVSKRVDRFKVEDVMVPELSWEIPSPKQFLNLAALAVSRRLRLAY